MLVDKDREVEGEEFIELVTKSDKTREELVEVGGTVIVVVTVVVICWEVVNMFIEEEMEVVPTVEAVVVVLGTAKIKTENIQLNSASIIP